MEKKYRPHPLEIFNNIWQVIYLLLIPVVRGLLLALQGNFTVWLAGAWKDVFILVLIGLIAVLKWYNCTISINNEALSVNSGLFYKRDKVIPLRNLCTISKSENIFYRQFKVASVTCDTSAGKSKGIEFRMKVGYELAEKIFCSMKDSNMQSNNLIRSYTPKNIYVILLAAITSNSLTGILLLAAFVSQAGKILGEQFADRLYGTFEIWTRALAFGLPPAAAGLGYIVIIGWLYTFCLNLLRHQRFEVTRKQQMLLIRYGVIIQRNYSIDTQKINYMDIRQTLYTKLLGLSSVFLNTFGYGKETDDISALIPAASQKQLQNSIKMLLPKFVQAEITLRPSKRSLTRFMWNPLVVIAAIISASLVGVMALPEWKELIGWLCLMGVIPTLWFLTVRIIDRFTGGIGITKECITVKYSKGFSFHTVVIPLQKIAMVRSVQSVFQIKNKSCDLYIYSYSESIKQHRIRNISTENAKAIIKAI